MSNPSMLYFAANGALYLFLKYSDEIRSHFYGAKIGPSGKITGEVSLFKSSDFNLLEAYTPLIYHSAGDVHFEFPLELIENKEEYAFCLEMESLSGEVIRCYSRDIFVSNGCIFIRYLNQIKSFVLSGISDYRVSIEKLLTI